MDASRFDRLVASLAAAASRRGFTRVLVTLPLASGLAALLDEESEAARSRHKTRRRRADRRERVHEQGKKKKKKKCAKAGQTTSKKRKQCCQGLVKDGSGVCAQPASDCIPATCAPNACGSVPDGCGGTLSCGGCAGNSVCHAGVCQPCDVTCVSDPATCGAGLQLALDEGGTVYVCPGLYRGGFILNTPVTVIGAGQGAGVASNTILVGSEMERVVQNNSGLVELEQLRITGGNSAGASGVGGGIANSIASTLRLTSCTVSGNKAGFSGAGIDNDASLKMIGCTVSGNESEFVGGGIDNTGSLEMIGCTLSGNEAANGGGGVQNFFGMVTMSDCIVSGNTAGTIGGGINNDSGTVMLDAACRVTGNHANPADLDSGGGIRNNGGTVTLNGAEVSGNDPDQCGGATPVTGCS